MDSERAARAALESYQLHGVRETGRELGRGSFAAVVEVDYKGMRCAAKKIHPILSEPDAEGDRLVGRFEEECRLLGVLRHPHVVQFLGIIFDPKTDLPVLVMEFLPVTLAQCLDRYGLLPEELHYAILRDVALGLRYLHEQHPPVIHRDLSANNVLLTGDMTAKISDLGMAKILRAHMSRMTRAPGTNSYMPPEVLGPDPRYDVKVDVFSFGVMMVHVLSGQWPLPSEATRVNPHNSTRVIGLSEAERRAKYLDTIGRGHPLMQLIEYCLSNSPNDRPTASDLVERVQKATAQHPLTFSNRVEMMSRIVNNEREKEELQTRVEELEGQITDLRNETKQQEAALSLEVEQLQLQVADLEAEKTHLTTSASAREQLHQAQLEERDQLYQTKLQEKERLMKEQKAELQGMEQLLKWEKELHQTDVHRLHAEVEEKEQQYQAELKEKEKLQRENDQLNQVELQEREQLRALKKEEKLHQANIQQQLQAKETQLHAKNMELLSQNTLLSQNRTTIERLKSRLQLAREFLVKGNQVHFLSPNAKLVWKECAPMPLKMACAQATVINGQVYVGGGDTESDGNCYLVCKYDPEKNEWSTLPPAPVKLCGIGQLNGKLVLVGGMLQTERKTADIHVFEDNQQWEKSIPAMPSARSTPAVLSHKNLLVVCGGKGDAMEYHTIFVYNGLKSQWSSTQSDHLSVGRQSSVVMGNYCFVAMGYDGPIVNQQTRSVISILLPSCTLVQTLPDMPHYDSSIATISGSVLAVGGVPKVTSMSLIVSVVSPFRRSETLYRDNSSSKVHAYCPTASSWIHIGDIPAPRNRVTTATLPSEKLLVMGGGNAESDFSNTVFMGSIKIRA